MGLVSCPVQSGNESNVRLVSCPVQSPRLHSQTALGTRLASHYSHSQTALGTRLAPHYSHSQTALGTRLASHSRQKMLDSCTSVCVHLHCMDESTPLPTNTIPPIDPWLSFASHAPSQIGVACESAHAYLSSCGTNFGGLFCRNSTSPISFSSRDT